MNDEQVRAAELDGSGDLVSTVPGECGYIPDLPATAPEDFERPAPDHLGTPCKFDAEHGYGPTERECTCGVADTPHRFDCPGKDGK